MDALPTRGAEARPCKSRLRLIWLETHAMGAVAFEEKNAGKMPALPRSFAQTWAAHYAVDRLG
jgi:hypothetical protein